VNDLVIRNARIVDGTGTPWFRGAIGVKDGFITEIGAVTESKMEIDARDRFVAPGFIDFHSHNDLYLLTEPRNTMKVAQGVTTEVLGQDGISCAPILPGGFRTVAALVQPLDGVVPPGAWRSVDDYLNRLHGHCAVNVAYLVPHGTLRAQVLDNQDRPASAQEIRQLAQLLRDGLEAGAFGFSSGLEYLPSRATEMKELLALAEVVGEYGGIYVTHVRSYDDAYLAAIAEAVEIGRHATIPVHISHFVAWGRRHHGEMSRLLEVVEEARATGVDVTFDVYPYDCASTLALFFLPEMVQGRTPDQLSMDLSSPSRRAEIADEISQGPRGIDLDWSFFYVSVGAESVDARGDSIAEIAQRQSRTVGELICDLLQHTALNAGFIVRAYVEPDVDAAVVHRLAMIGSDGIPLGDSPHPRGWGAFAKVISEYCVRRKVLPLEEGIAAMTGRPAARLGLRDRGHLRSGFAADLVLFDPAAVEARSTYERPRELASGMDLVLVNGAAVWGSELPSAEYFPGMALHPRDVRAGNGSDRR
jgi:N-acyl-D-amino-acid deacylase